MDKEILRIIIIATGLVVVMGIIAWSYIKEKRAERRRNLYDDSSEVDFDQIIVTSPSSQQEDADDDFDVVPVSGVNDGNKADSYFDDDEFDGDDDDDFNHTHRLITPHLIQFSLVANADEGFNGLNLAGAFEMAGLEYGTLKIFERLDENRLVDFGVACMVEPGTFPEKDWESFHCPGIVFFMQPGELENAQAVFDDFVDTIRLMANELDGVIWDHERQLLTESTVQAIRRSL